MGRLSGMMGICTVADTIAIWNVDVDVNLATAFVRSEAVPDHTRVRTRALLCHVPAVLQKFLLCTITKSRLLSAVLGAIHPSAQAISSD